MPIVPTTHTVTGTIASTSEMNSFFRDPLNFLLAPPTAVLRQNAAQSLASGNWVDLAFQVEDLDSVNGHDNVTNNTRYTAVYPGWYDGLGYASFVANATGLRGSRLAVNGSSTLGREALVPATPGPDQCCVPCHGFVFLNVGDYVTVQGLQTSGIALNTSVANEAVCALHIKWVSN